MAQNQQLETLMAAATKFRDAGKGAAELMATLERIDFFQFDLERWEHYRQTELSMLKLFVEGTVKMIESIGDLMEGIPPTN